MSDPALVFGALAAGAAFKFGVLSWIGKKRRENFELVGRVAELYVYPVKSFRPFRVDVAECTETGLRYNGVNDRHWLVIDENAGFVTQRNEPNMALVETRIHGEELEISAPDMTSLRIPIKVTRDKGKVINCRIWTDRVDVVDCGEKAATWINKYLKKRGCRIVSYVAGLTNRDVFKHETSWTTYAHPGDRAAFGDFCSYFLLSEASLSDLNQRLQKPLTAMTFRPNILVDDCPPFAEDEWMELRIGEDVTLRYLDACPRCTLTAVNPTTGVKDPNQEPLTTLRTFRLRPEKYGKSPLMGTYLGLESRGTIRVGDPVYALKWPHTP